RFLQACGDGNMVIANITTPANFFHLMRRQFAWPFRKPVVVMSPKSLLRHPACVSAIDEVGPGTAFQPVIAPTHTAAQARKIERLLFCSGKIYYDLLEAMDADAAKRVAIVRLEQLYPIDQLRLMEIAGRYPQAARFWVQEEPANMGPWSFLNARIPQLELQLISRRLSASPATGFKKKHDEQQARIINEALGGG